MNKKGTTHETLSSENLSYAFGRTETWLEIYAQSIGCAKRELTDGVAAMLFSQGEWPGTGVREVRGHTTKVDKRLRKVAVGSRSRGKLPGKTASQKRVTCEHCGKKCMPQGIKRHIYWKHGAGASQGKRAA